VNGSGANLCDRAAGALWGLAIGDALGMPTQLLSRRQIMERYGEIGWFEAPADDHPVAAGLAAGSVTDDTHQAVLLARLLSPGAYLDQQMWAAVLVRWEEEMRAAGSHDLLGPSTTAALAAFQAGSPVNETGRAGTTNGAAMRIAPVGVAVGVGDLDLLVDRVVEASLLTHNTSLALAGAAAVAAAVSAGVDGATPTEAAAVAVRAADLASTRGNWVAGASVARRLEWAVDAASSISTRDLPAFVADLVGTGLASQESVPAAFAIVAAYPDDPWKAVCTAASVGGDCDTIAAMAGAVSGAAHGTEGFPPDAVSTVRHVNALDMDDLARHLLGLRCG
jgi:ADP-ribosylglycohydrolase